MPKNASSPTVPVNSGTPPPDHIVEAVPPTPPPPPVNRMLTPARVWVRNASAQPLRHAEGTAAPGGRFQLHEHEVGAYGAHIVRE